MQKTIAQPIEMALGTLWTIGVDLTDPDTGAPVTAADVAQAEFRVADATNGPRSPGIGERRILATLNDGISKIDAGGRARLLIGITAEMQEAGEVAAGLCHYEVWWLHADGRDAADPWGMLTVRGTLKAAHPAPP